MRLVHSFDELRAAPWTDGVNAVCWARQTPGGFAEVARHFADLPFVTPLEPAMLRSKRWSREARAAVAWMLEDFERLEALGLQPELNHVQRYPRDAADALVPTHVYSFHVDSSPVAVDTWLCTYHGLPSEGIEASRAIRCVDEPSLRAALLRQFGGADGADFEQELCERSYHLHYVPAPGARPWSFGVGNLWRIATSWPGCPVPPCIHRAPEDRRGTSRLLVIS